MENKNKTLRSGLLKTPMVASNDQLSKPTVPRR